MVVCVSSILFIGFFFFFFVLIPINSAGPPSVVRFYIMDIPKRSSPPPPPRIRTRRRKSNSGTRVSSYYIIVDNYSLGHYHYFFFFLQMFFCPMFFFFFFVEECGLYSVRWYRSSWRRYVFFLFSSRNEISKLCKYYYVIYRNGSRLLTATTVQNQLYSVPDLLKKKKKTYILYVLLFVHYCYTILCVTHGLNSPRPHIQTALVFWS